MEYPEVKPVEMVGLSFEMLQTTEKMVLRVSVTRVGTVISRKKVLKVVVAPVQEFNQKAREQPDNPPPMTSPSAGGGNREEAAATVWLNK